MKTFGTFESFLQLLTSFYLFSNNFSSENNESQNLPKIHKTENPSAYFKNLQILNLQAYYTFYKFEFYNSIPHFYKNMHHCKNKYFQKNGKKNEKNFFFRKIFFDFFF